MPLTSNSSFVKKAANEAKRLGRHPQHRLGAVIVKGSNIISIGHNFSEVHAESHAIKRAWRRDSLKGATLIVVRVRKDNRYGMSKPCPCCLRQIIDAGIKRVVYTDDNGEVNSYKITPEMIELCDNISSTPKWRYK